MHSPDYRTMERKDMLQAEIDAGLSRIDSTVASFITKSQKLTTNSTVQELIRMKHQLAILVEEVDYNIKSIDDNRKRLLDMEFYKWPIEYVSRFDIVHRRYFRMKACMTELVDKIESANAMSGSAATIIIKEETVVKTETTDTLTEESITDSSNGIDENRDKSISNNCHHAATTFANVQTTETRTTPTKEEEPLKQINSTEVLNKSGENRRKHRIIEPRIRSQSKDKTPINSPEQQNRSQRASSSPVKKKSKKSAKPLIIPTERTSSVQIVPPAPAVFDPRSKSYQMWKQAANASQKPVGTVPLQSYAIPSDMSRFKNDFQKQREQVERGSQIEHVTLTVVSPPINTEDSITAAKQMERTKAVQDEKKTSRATSVDKNPSPINSTYEENDSYKLEKVAAPGQSSICQANITQTSSQQTKPILKVEKTREKKEEEDDDSDIEVIDVIIRNVPKAETSETPVLKKVDIHNSQNINPIVSSVNRSNKHPVEVEITSCSQMNNLVNAGLVTLTSQYHLGSSKSKNKKACPTLDKVGTSELEKRYENYREIYEKAMPKSSSLRFARETEGLRDLRTGELLPCTFYCGGRHYPFRCTKYADGAEKRERCKAIGLCLICLMPLSAHSIFCSYTPKCPICKKCDHHVVVCTA